MPEPAPAAPAAPAADEPLSFKTEADRDAAVAKFSEGGREPTTDDLAEIDRVMAADVEEQPAPATADEPSAEPASEPSAEPQAPAEPAAASAPQPAAEPAAAAPAAPAEEPRNWTINEELINKYDEQYQDRSGRSRGTFTHKTAEDLLESFRNAQRRIRFLEGDGRSEAENTGFQRAKAEAQEQIDKLKEQLQSAQSSAPAAAPAAAPQAPGAPAGPAGQPAPTATAADARKAFTEAIAALDAVKEGDEFDHVPDLMRALKNAAVLIGEQDNQIAQQADNITKIQTEGTKAFADFRQEQTAATQQSASEKEQEARTKAWNIACQQVDGFVGGQQCPTELKTGRSYDQLTREAVVFHNELARHFTGKTQAEVADKDRVEAVASYLAGSPQLVARVKAVGLTEPEDYRRWVVLDQVDALRTGWYRDPASQQWTQRFAQDSGKPVQFPDMASSYAEYRRITGQDRADVSKAVAANTQQVVDAINQRDNGVVQMDETHTARSDHGGALSEAEANRKLDELETVGGIDEALRRAAQGDLSMVEQYNAASTTLGNGIAIQPHLYERFLPATASK